MHLEAGGSGPTTGNIINQKGMLERRSCAFHFCCRTRRYGHPTLIHKALSCLPGFDGIFWARIKATNALFADQVKREPLDSIHIQHQSGGYHQVEIGRASCRERVENKGKTDTKTRKSERLVV